MSLKDYINKKTNIFEIAKRVRISTSMIRKIVVYNLRPSPDLALRIAKATNNEVTVLELLYPNGELEQMKAELDALAMPAQRAGNE